MRRKKMTINMISNQWQTQHLVVKDSILDDVAELVQIQAACAYMEEWSGWKQVKEGHPKQKEDHPEQSTLAFITEGELPPNGSKEFWRVQSLRLSDTGQMIGFLAIYHGYPTDNFVWINYLFIHPNFQGKGYGQELVRGLCDKVKSLGYTGMRTIVDLKNWPAVRFWSQVGFDKIIQYHGDKIISDNTFAHLTLEKLFVS
jgi:ribosomal protein S18 acetylase RimI-like enzyme